MAEFTGEPASEVNRRAQDRNGLALEKGDRLQVVDFACHLKNRDTRGRQSPGRVAGQLNALRALINAIDGAKSDSGALLG